MEVKQICVGAAIIKDKKILLTKRSPQKKYFPDYWVFPADALEETDYSLEAALQRRIKEEIGIHFDPTAKLGFYETHVPDGRIIGLMFTGSWSGELHINPEEISETVSK